MTIEARWLALAALAFTTPLHAADVVAGKAAADSRCIECHAADDWQGEDAAALESLIRDIVAGRVNHKRKLDLSSADIANIAAWWAESSR